MEAVSVNHMELSRTGKVGTMAVAASALFLSCVWNHPFVVQVQKNFLAIGSLDVIKIQRNALDANVYLMLLVEPNLIDRSLKIGPTDCLWPMFG